MTIRAAFVALRRLSRRFVRDERGVILALAGMMMTVLALVIGLGVEVGWWYALQRQNQSAADAAALSAAYEYAHSNLTLTTAQLTPFATAAANRNKYAGDTPIVTLPGAGQVQAVLNRTQGSWFSKLAGLTNVTIQTGAIAQVTALAPGCIVALSQNAATGIYVQGSANINAPDCTLISDSKSANSILLHDNGVNITAKTVVTAGDVSGHVNTNTFNVTYPEQTGAAVISDPYASTLTHANLISGMPSTATACVRNSSTKTWSGSCTITNPSLIQSGDKLSGNTRIQGNWTVNGTVTLLNGTYWITDGDLTVKNATLTCSGCTVNMTTGGGAGAKIGFVQTSSNGILILAAPSSGTFAGKVLLQDTVAGVTQDLCTVGGTSYGMCLNANSPAQLSGVVYFPNSDIGFQGTPVAGGSQCLVLIAKTVQLSGNPTLATSGCSALGLDTSSLQIKTVALVK